MHLASIKPDMLAIVKGDIIIAVDETVARTRGFSKEVTMIDLIENYESIKNQLESAAEKGGGKKLHPKELRPPVERPSKIWAAASNYRRGSSGLEEARGRGEMASMTPEERLEMIFLKPPSAIIGPEDSIIIPKGADTIFPELELCVVIGKQVRHVAKEQALEAVFGYTIILDVTARGYGSGQNALATRCVRKGFETFAPIGPWITTADEIPDPNRLMMRLWVNGELVQSASTGAMINNVVELVTYLSSVTTLYPGDLIATGNPDAPEFQRQMRDGDRLAAEIESIGAMNLAVRAA